ncbi:MAG: thiamine pyrophosphate-dependent enzyme [Bacteroidales bacterium]
MEHLFLLGDEAIAQGAMDAGLSGMYAYPGTPSTEIMEYIQSSVLSRDMKIHAVWSANEKTAMEEALGMSYAGKRALVAMKHVGLNVAADPFMNAAVTGVNGGLVIVSADDPSMHSSQNEQDSRYYGKFALIPVLEPSNQQEAYSMTRTAFSLSEEYKVPVMLRITTRLAHSRSGVRRDTCIPQNDLILSDNKNQFILLPSNARVNYRKLLGQQDEFLRKSENSPYNQLILNPEAKKGVLASGIAWNYVNEVIARHSFPFNLLKVSQYPAPLELMRKLYANSDEIIVAEEGYPFLEEMLTGIIPLAKPVRGRLDGTLPRDGELNPNLLSKALGFPEVPFWEPSSSVTPRPPSLCSGCSHADVYQALNIAMEHFNHGKVFSDIGCYTLGALPPYESINTCVDMGASITMAKGAADSGLHPAVCVIGDSTFTHSGMTGLLDAVIENSPITVIISDNGTTGMTGGQSSAATGRIENICLGLGVNPDHLHTLIPLKKNLESNAEVLLREMEYKGVSVIIARRECIQTAARRQRNKSNN